MLDQLRQTELPREGRVHVQACYPHTRTRLSFRPNLITNLQKMSFLVAPLGEETDEQSAERRAAAVNNLSSRDTVGGEERENFLRPRRELFLLC